jgi:K+-sensing histidine kinase KdpD
VRTEAELDAIRRRVVNVVGHALRTPVTTLCGMADELARRADDPEARAVLADGVRRNGRIVEQLLDDLLVASDVSTALPVAEPADIDLAARARDVWDGYGDARSLAITGEGRAHAAPPVVEGALAKLLDNAHRYSDGAVEVAVHADNGRVVAEITSVGGLPSEAELPLCTEAFFRGEHAVMRSPGLGIGLTVARALAQHAGGDVVIAVAGDRFIATLELPS